MSLSNGELFLRLLRNIKTIYKKELTNESYIYLYEVGEYWIAFEKSAYLLSLQLKEQKSEVSAIKMDFLPFPILFSSVDDITRQKLTSKNVYISRNHCSYIKVKTTSPTDVEEYNRWYRSNMKLNFMDTQC